jgi:hypothetical protein
MTPAFGKAWLAPQDDLSSDLLLSDLTFATCIIIVYTSALFSLGPQQVHVYHVAVLRSPLELDTLMDFYLSNHHKVRNTNLHRQWTSRLQSRDSRLYI